MEKKNNYSCSIEEKISLKKQALVKRAHKADEEITHIELGIRNNKAEIKRIIKEDMKTHIRSSFSVIGYASLIAMFPLLSKSDPNLPLMIAGVNEYMLRKNLLMHYNLHFPSLRESLRGIRKLKKENKKSSKKINAIDSELDKYRKSYEEAAADLIKRYNTQIIETMNAKQKEALKEAQLAFSKDSIYTTQFDSSSISYIDLYYDEIVLGKKR